MNHHLLSWTDTSYGKNKQRANTSSDVVKCALSCGDDRRECADVFSSRAEDI